MGRIIGPRMGLSLAMQQLILMLRMAMVIWFLIGKSLLPQLFDTYGNIMPGNVLTSSNIDLNRSMSIYDYGNAR